MKLGKKLRHARQVRELSQQELATRAGLSPATILRLERGQGHTPHQATLRRLAGALNVDPDWLTDDRQDLADFHRKAAEDAAQAGAAAGGAPVSPEGAGSVAAPEAATAPREDVYTLLRRAIQEIERAGPPQRRRPAGEEGRLGTHRPHGIGPRAPEARRLAPVFDIGADFDRDWHDGDFPVGHGHDERPALNDDPSGFWCVVHGESMEPDLREGDLLYFSPERAPFQDGQICLVRTHDFATVKWAFTAGADGLRLAASNPRYPDQVVNLREDVVQLHRALCVLRMLE